MIHRVDNRAPDYELFIENLVRNLRRSTLVVCGVCRTETPVWNAVLSRSHLYHCESCFKSKDLASAHRRDLRWQLSIPFSCRQGGETVFGFTSDLSERGLGLSHPRLRPGPGEVLRLTLFGDQRFDFEAIVRYSRGHDLGARIGVRFEGSDAENLVKVSALCSHFDHQLNE